MGQRLNIEIWYGGKVIANAYYHWSAYSKNAAKITQDIIDRIIIRQDIYGKYPNRSFSIDVYDEMLIREIQKNAVKIFEFTGAGINDDEKRRLKDIGYPDEQISKFKTAILRDEGLISITDEGINETRSNQEEYVIIYLDEQRVEYHVCSEDNPFEWQKKQKEEHNKSANYKDLPVCPFNFSDIKLYDFSGFSEFVDDIIEKHDGYCFDPIRQKVITFIY